jgi:anti-anti-sigma factor
VSSLEVSVRHIDSGADEPATIVSASGQAGVEDGSGFRWLLELQAAGEKTRIILDLSRLSSMDWWAALILLWVVRVMHRRGGALVLASPQSAVAALLRSAGAHQVVPVYDTVGQAIHPGAAGQTRGTRAAGHCAAQCPQPAATAIGQQIDPRSRLSVLHSPNTSCVRS